MRIRPLAGAVKRRIIPFGSPGMLTKPQPRNLARIRRILGTHPSIQWEPWGPGTHSIRQARRVPGNPPETPRKPHEPGVRLPRRDLGWFAMSQPLATYRVRVLGCRVNHAERRMKVCCNGIRQEFRKGACEAEGPATSPTPGRNSFPSRLIDRGRKVE